MSRALVCPHCSTLSEAKCIDTRGSGTGSFRFVRRRRQCGDCSGKFTTREYVLDGDPRERSMDKVRSRLDALEGMYESLVKRITNAQT